MSQLQAMMRKSSEKGPSMLGSFAFLLPRIYALMDEFNTG